MGAKLINHSQKFAYSIYLCSGLLPWNYFTSVLTRNVHLFVDNANLLKKSTLPFLTLPLVTLFTETVNFSMAMGVFLLFLAAVQQFPGWIILWVIPMLIVQQLLALGIGTLLGCFHVFFRDIGKSIGIVLQFWFWLTPIVYVSSVLPPLARKILLIVNPLAALVQSYQGIILEHQVPQLAVISLEFVLSLFFLTVAIATYNRLAPGIVDEL
jgi:lipopolysaccharide transport system permease protein